MDTKIIAQSIVDAEQNYGELNIVKISNPLLFTNRDNSTSTRQCEPKNVRS
jgi:hypothetical protein